MFQANHTELSVQQMFLRETSPSTHHPYPETAGPQPAVHSRHTLGAVGLSGSSGVSPSVRFGKWLRENPEFNTVLQFAKAFGLEDSDLQQAFTVAVYH